MDVRVTLIDPLLTIHKSAVVSIFLNFVHGRYRTARSWDWEWAEWSNGTVHFDRTGPTEKRGPPRKLDWFFRNFSGWTEPIHSVLDRNFWKFWLNGSRLWTHCNTINLRCELGACAETKEKRDRLHERPPCWNLYSLFTPCVSLSVDTALYSVRRLWFCIKYSLVVFTFFSEICAK